MKILRVEQYYIIGFKRKRFFNRFFLVKFIQLKQVTKTLFDNIEFSEKKKNCK